MQHPKKKNARNEDLNKEETAGGGRGQEVGRGVGKGDGGRAYW
jgi:hypothetical protein